MSVKKYYFLGKKELFPICRSITGKGIKKSLKIIKRHFPKLKIFNVKVGKKVFDWKIPAEWNINSAYIKDKNNKILVDFNENNLHVVGYSQPIMKFLNKNDLLKKLYSLKDNPNAIPYITSYYKKSWGFCVTDNLKKTIINNYKDDDKFKLSINSSFNNRGFLNYGEYFIKGNSKKEILISTYLCHPSMANNELSGPIVAMSLIDFFKKKKLNKNIRFVFIPETIGSIVYLEKNLKNLKKNVIAGYNLTCIGDEKNHGCMLTKYGNTISDKSLIEAYKNLRIKYKKFSFIENGSDERQYNSPGIDLPIASIFRSKYGTYPEYHTSLDNFNLVTLKGLSGGFKVAKKAIEIIQNKIVPKTKILCEPQMGKRGLYPTLSTIANMKKSKKMMNFIQYSDGKNSLYEIAELINLSYKDTLKIYLLLIKNKIIE